jgi:hypothetical protein
MRHCQQILRRRARRQPRKGAALVLTMILLVVLSATAAAALSMVGSERRVIEDQEAAALAHTMARSAYNEFITDPQVLLPTFDPMTFAGPDSAYFTFSDGYAWVSVQRIRPSVSGSPVLFLIRSRAVRTSHRPGKTPVAERVFAQYAQWQTGSMGTLAAWTSLTGLTKNGGAGTISGADNCGVAGAVAGVAVPASPGYQQNGGSSVPSGSPNILDMGPQSDANAMIKIDWSGIVTATSLAPDLSVPGAAWPSFANPDYWPVIYVDQAASWALPASGRGLLVVRNNMTISDAKQWDGIILVGGTFTSNGNNTVSGALVTGLNVLLGQSVSTSDVGNGTKAYRFDSCNVDQAASRFRGLAPLRNTSADNWKSF